MTKQERIKNYMEKYNLSEVEATQLWLEDEGLATNEEVEALTKKSKEQKRRYEKSDKPRKKTTRERKVDTEKGDIFKIIARALTENGIEVTGQKNEAELYFTQGGNKFTIKLTRHRPPKVT